MTYKLKLFLVIQKKKKFINIKSFKNYIFLWFTYIGLLIFNIKLTHLVQKLKKLRLDETNVEKLNYN